MLLPTIAVGQRLSVEPVGTAGLSISNYNASVGDAGLAISDRYSLGINAGWYLSSSETLAVGFFVERLTIPFRVPGKGIQFSSSAQMERTSFAYYGARLPIELRLRLSRSPRTITLLYVTGGSLLAGYHSPASLGDPRILEITDGGTRYTLTYHGSLSTRSLTGLSFSQGIRGEIRAHKRAVILFGTEMTIGLIPIAITTLYYSIIPNGSSSGFSGEYTARSQGSSINIYLGLQYGLHR